MSLVEVLHYLALLIGIGTLLIGILAVLKPERMSKAFGISVSGSALPFVISTGVRDIFMGLTVLLLFVFKQWEALGYINLFLGFVAVSDFLVVRKHGDNKTSLTHFAGALIVISYGVWLVSN